MYRVIVSSSKVGDVVLDPFFGTGTTGAIAKKLGRHFIGIEKDTAYIQGAKDRIAAVEMVKDARCLEYMTKKKMPRIPFGNVVERGLLQPGDMLFDAQRKHFAVVRADGTLKSETAEGSIHQVGAAAQNAPACNGWTYWYYEKPDKQLCPIDDLREVLRAEMGL